MTRTMDPSTLPSLAEFKEFLHYDPATGVFTWIKSPGGYKIKPGMRAGHKEKHGYFRVRFKNRNHGANRLAWFFVHGNWPEGQIDHINGDTTDDSIRNLRDVSQRVNLCNQKKHRDGKPPGTTLFDGRWQSHVQFNGKKKHLGYYDTAEEAHRVRNKFLFDHNIDF